MICFSPSTLFQCRQRNSHMPKFLPASRPCGSSSVTVGHELLRLDLIVHCRQLIWKVVFFYTEVSFSVKKQIYWHYHSFMRLEVFDITGNIFFITDMCFLCTLRCYEDGVGCTVKENSAPPLQKTLSELWWLSRRWGKIIRTVLCCVVYSSCAQWYAHTSSS